MAFRIMCINKANGQHESPCAALGQSGWVNEAIGRTGLSTREEMYHLTQDAMVVEAISARRARYVKTKVDSSVCNNLLSLMEGV